MNPPSALQGAMSRDRKPFTYTPGGLDLSEIKSERMAQRLMRNAMNPGVPEKPIQTIQSPPMPSTPIAVPNFNCLPVQVFPTFNLPANPKSLLRTRSTPDQPKEPPVSKIPILSHYANHSKPHVAEYYDAFTKPKQLNSMGNSNRPASMYEYSNVYTLPTNYGNTEISSEIVNTIPERNNNTTNLKLSPKTDINNDNERQIMTETTNNTQIDKCQLEIKDQDEASKHLEVTLDEQKEVKVVKQSVNTEQKNDIINGDQNGDTEAEMTIKLPTKKSGTKTETNVEVVKKILPDGGVEEIKTTTTKTTIDGKTETKIQTEKTIIPKEEDDEEIEEIEEEEEEEVHENDETNIQKDKKQEETFKKDAENTEISETGKENNIIKTEEKFETTTTTTKKVSVIQDEEPVVEDEEIEETEPVTEVINKSVKEQVEYEEDGQEEQEEEEQIEKYEPVQSKEVEDEIKEKDEETEEKEEYEEDIAKSVPETNLEKKVQVNESSEVQEEEEEEVDEEEVIEETKQEPAQILEEEEDVTVVKDQEQKKESKEQSLEKDEKLSDEKKTDEPDETKEEIITEKVILHKTVVEENDEPSKQEPVIHEIKHEIKLEYDEPKLESSPRPEIKIPLREPSIPLEKVEDVEIKPIGPAETISKSRLENTEIITTTGGDKPIGLCTEYNRVENIITVNRTTKTLDQAYENITQPSLPTVKTYFAPSIDRITTSPLPSRPYQPVYPPEPTTERRHSLLLERLSVERQMPADIHQYNSSSNQSYEQQQQQWLQEPQAEVLTVSNVKPSSLSQNNQQWYQQSRETTTYNNFTPAPPAPAPVSPIWSQPKPQQQQTYKPQPTYSTQPTYQAPTYQPTYQSPASQLYQPPAQQTTYQAPIQQPTYQQTPPQPKYQTSTPQPQYHPTYSETVQEKSTNISSTFAPKPTWVSTVDNTIPIINAPSNQYSYVTKDTTDSYKETTQYSSSYVPPPWEQDANYATNNSQSLFQSLPTKTFTPAADSSPSQNWKPKLGSKFTKATPTSYIPPAPNQSFVKPVIVEPPRLPGRKTYYSEYERRYITVPESNYIPTETKFQPQPDPSPQYYYDNNEPSETVEHQWRKELREFTEKTSQTQTEVNVKPPWEEDQAYAKTPAATYTPTPTWSQTLRPRSWRERSFESDFVSQEWPKTNTLGRGRPLNSYSKPDSGNVDRVRGVSVDRYNPNSYQSPVAAEHPPVPTHTLTTPAPHAYHNPNVPAYHARASAEPREQQANYQHPRAFREPRASPFQSRSFKYLQWITGTDD